MVWLIFFYRRRRLQDAFPMLQREIKSCWLREVQFRSEILISAAAEAALVENLALQEETWDNFSALLNSYFFFFFFFFSIFFISRGFVGGFFFKYFFFLTKHRSGDSACQKPLRSLPQWIRPTSSSFTGYDRQNDSRALLIQLPTFHFIIFVLQLKYIDFGHGRAMSSGMKKKVPRRSRDEYRINAAGCGARECKCTRTTYLILEIAIKTGW